MAVEVHPDVHKEQSPSNLVAEVLSEPVPQEEVAESESSGRVDYGEACHCRGKGTRSPSK